MAAFFEEAVCDVLTAKALDACHEHGVRTLVIGDMVAANSRLRAMAEERAARRGSPSLPPDPGCAPIGAAVSSSGIFIARVWSDALPATRRRAANSWRSARLSGLVEAPVKPATNRAARAQVRTWKNQPAIVNVCPAAMGVGPQGGNRQ